MKIWTDGCETFENEDDARDNACAEMTWDDYEEYFRDNVNFHDFFTRVREAMTKDNSDEFFITFENEFCNAMNNYFNNNYWEEEEEEEEEEQQATPTISILC